MDNYVVRFLDFYKIQIEISKNNTIQIWSPYYT